MSKFQINFHFKGLRAGRLFKRRALISRVGAYSRGGRLLDIVTRIDAYSRGSLFKGALNQSIKVL